MKYLLKLSQYLLAILGFGSDVISVTSGTAGNAGNVAASLITYLAAQLLEVAELNMVLDFKQSGLSKISSKYPGTLNVN